MKVFNGKEFVNEYIIKAKAEAEAFKEASGRNVALAVLLVGDSPAAVSYIKKNAVMCAKAGIDAKLIEMDECSTTSEIVACIKRLNKDIGIDGILVQLPLPSHVDSVKVTEAISPDKDVDGVTRYSAAMLYLGSGNPFLPNTPMGVMKIIQTEGIELSGKRAVVLGRSNIVGKPMAMLLMKENATVTVCHSKTKNIKEICKEADVLVAAIGKANFVTADMVKEGASVFDVGTNFVDGKMTGDVHFESVAPKASFITPVPNGCGPITVCMLIENTLRAAKVNSKK